MIGVALTAAGTLALLAAEARGSRPLKWAAKPVASAGFLVAAVEWRAAASPAGRAALVALALGFAGDVLLIPKREAAFRAGIFAFFASHVAYIVAFARLGVDVVVAGVALLALAGVGAPIGRWLQRHVRGGLRVLVVAYLAVITTMVAAAAGTRAPPVVAGALAFYLSDLSVARDRFVAPGFANRAWGLPLYYAAQLVLAYALAPGSPS